MPIPETGARPVFREGGENLRVTSDRVGHASVLRLRGELDLRTVPKLRARLAEALERDDGAVVVDLTEVGFIDSTGLSALLNALRRLTRARRQLVLVTAEGPVLRLLRMTRLDTTFVLRDSVEAALASAGHAEPAAA